MPRNKKQQVVKQAVSKKRVTRKNPKRNKRVTKKDNYFKKQLMVMAARLLVQTAAVAANAALYNKEVGKRLNKRSHEALQVVGQLAKGVREDIRAGVKAANAVKKRKAQVKKVKDTKSTEQKVSKKATKRDKKK